MSHAKNLASKEDSTNEFVLITDLLPPPPLPLENCECRAALLLPLSSMLRCLARMCCLAVSLRRIIRMTESWCVGEVLLLFIVGCEPSSTFWRLLERMGRRQEGGGWLSSTETACRWYFNMPGCKKRSVCCSRVLRFVRLLWRDEVRR